MRELTPKDVDAHEEFERAKRESDEAVRVIREARRMREVDADQRIEQTPTKMRPALSTEEWARLSALTEEQYYNDSPEWVLTAYLNASRDELSHHGLPHLPYNEQPEPYALAAVALNALPAGHPGKITRTDVEDIEDAARRLEIYLVYPSTAHVVRRIAAKLAALLPPTP